MRLRKERPTQFRLFPALLLTALALAIPASAGAVTPNIAFTSPTSSGIENSHQANVSAYGNAVAFTATCTISNNGANSSPLSCGYQDYWVSTGITVLAEGYHTITVVATATDGSNATKTITGGFTTDWTAPDTYMTGGPGSGPISDASPSWSFSGTDANGIASYQCNLDSAGWSTCSSPYTASSLADGDHTFAVRAVDNATNVDGSPSTVNFSVDTQAPTVSYTVKPPAESAGADVTFEYASDEENTTFFCDFDGVDYYPCPTSFTELSAGPHTLGLYGADIAGNQSTTAVSWTWNSYPSPPETVLVSAPDAAAAAETATFAFSSADGNSFECSVDDGAWSACTSPTSVSGLAAGSHSFGVRAVDPAGQVDPTPLALAFTVPGTSGDTTKPSVSKLSLKSGYFKLKLSEAGKVTVKIASCKKVKGSKKTKCKTVRKLSGSASSAKTLKLKIKKRLKRPSRYRITVSAVDLAGNKRTVTKTFKLK